MRRFGPIGNMALKNAERLKPDRRAAPVRRVLGLYHCLRRDTPKLDLKSYKSVRTYRSLQGCADFLSDLLDRNDPFTTHPGGLHHHYFWVCAHKSGPSLPPGLGRAAINMFGLITTGTIPSYDRPASQPYDRRNVGIAVNIRPTPPLTKSVSSRSCVMFLRPEGSDPSSKYLRT